MMHLLMEIKFVMFFFFLHKDFFFFFFLNHDLIMAMQVSSSVKSPSAHPKEFKVWTQRCK